MRVAWSEAGRVETMWVCRVVVRISGSCWTRSRWWGIW